METFIEIIISIVLFLGVSYLFFYKYFIKSLGEQYAKIVTIEKVTLIEESIKKGFNENFEAYKASVQKEISAGIERLKSSLEKENIAFQIALAELTKVRLQRVEELFVDLIEIQQYIRDNMFIAINEEEYQKCRKEFTVIYNRVDKSRKICSLYLTDEIIKSIIDLMNSSFSAFMAFSKMYRSDPKKFENYSPYNYAAQQAYYDRSDANMKAYAELNDEVGKFPELLMNLSKEIKEKMIFKGIDF